MAQLELECGSVCFPSQLSNHCNDYHLQMGESGGAGAARLGRAWLSTYPSAVIPSYSLQSLTLAWATHAPPPFRESCLRRLHQRIYQD